LRWPELACQAIHSFLRRRNLAWQGKRETDSTAARCFSGRQYWLSATQPGSCRRLCFSRSGWARRHTDGSDFAAGGTSEACELAAKVSDAWINFARKGDPNHSGLPKWPAFTADAGPVMVFDKTCEVRGDFDRELRRVVADALGA